MALNIHEAPGPRLGTEEIAAWDGVPTAVISDELNRAGAMAAEIKPVAAGMRFAAEALTVQTMAADNAALHYAVTEAWPGAALVVDAGGYTRAAVWGDVLTQAARHRGIAAIVVDGAVRDVAELRQCGIAVFARAVVPAGPQKGWGGSINATIQCGGVAVHPGDLVVGDDDGVAVVPRADRAAVLERCRRRMAKEGELARRIAAGATTVELLGLPPAEELGG